MDIALEYSKHVASSYYHHFDGKQNFDGKKTDFFIMADLPKDMFDSLRFLKSTAEGS